MKPKQLHSAVKVALGYRAKAATPRILADWRERIRLICKPCWELKYCPYGPLVEDFPLLPLARESAARHNDYLKGCLATGKMANGRPLDQRRRSWFKKSVAEFDPAAYPESIPKVLQSAECRVFGHVCPVYFVAESLTETKNLRTHTRVIPREVMLKVVRRDGQICQKCGDPVRDDEVEFDHVIPFSRGGAANPDNLRLVHGDCNRHKSNSLDEILASNPVLNLLQVKR